MNSKEKWSLFWVFVFGVMFCTVLLYPEAINNFIDNVLQIPLDERHN